MTFLVNGTKIGGMNGSQQATLGSAKNKPSFEHLEPNLEHIMILNKVYDPLVLFV
jgi:PBP1b-binding outer membrane lipoprotein LpoB